MNTPEHTSLESSATPEVVVPHNAIIATAILAYDGFTNKAADTKEAARDLIKLHILPLEGKAKTEAVKEVREALKAAGLTKQRVSDLLLEFGLRARAATEKPTKEEIDAAIIQKLVADALELLSGDAHLGQIALRRAHLALKGQEAPTE
jgi:hypothetical protein